MNAARNQQGPDRRSLGLQRTTALIAVLIGAVGSVALMLYVGRHNNSRLLLVLFGFWVIAPFVALGMAIMAAKRWSSLTRATLYIVTPVLTLVSLAVYGNAAFGPPRAKAAAEFVVVPPASSLIIAIAAFISRKKSN